VLLQPENEQVILIEVRMTTNTVLSLGEGPSEAPGVGRPSYSAGRWLLRSGITNALGCVVADLRHDYARTINKPLSAIDDAMIATIYAEQAAPAARRSSRKACQCASCAADMQFQGQSHILSVGVETEAIGVEGLRKAFAATYWRRVGIELPEIPPVLVNLHRASIGVRPEISLAALTSGERAAMVPRRLAPDAGLCPQEAAARHGLRGASDSGATRLNHCRQARRQGAVGRAWQSADWLHGLVFSGSGGGRIIMPVRRIASVEGNSVIGRR
jgi:hypothetical protein